MTKDEVHALAACTEESPRPDEEAVAPVAPLEIVSLLSSSREKREAPARVEEVAAFDESLLSCCLEGRKYFQPLLNLSLEKRRAQPVFIQACDSEIQDRLSE